MSVMHVIRGILLPVTALYQDIIWEQRGSVEMTASGCSSSSRFFIFFYSITCDYGIFRSAIGERKSNTNCIREEKKSYKRSCWDMVSGLWETIATESVFAIMADAIDGMVLL